ncbi:radical SAM protein [Ponticaulis sp.]|uniref:radical SAM protein n=1 Tax=Ponticaulis sp. TaxID=2020902 RepID=UPI000B6EF2EC|nr:radical SAM protein [Ponticaulis sp.]MAI90776.1 hypothetical protein [Ponticaulis sp.]OUX99001.1 MAG: hypothetical protein CBB65_10070 [Hyphomonadaceae bacterium TMED5]|tara:strand:- start:58568 stop:59710 length:1143 start_codon:yes stop_codon:yes gene_type:complete
MQTDAGFSTEQVQIFSEKLKKLLRARPDLRARYSNARRLQKIALHNASIELTNKCNLFCEGCFFFEGDKSALEREEEDLRKWEDLFKRLAASGIKHANLAGAEPALQTARIEAAARHIPHGLVYTNGTIQIPRHIPYAILISVWGNEAQTAELRGGNHLAKSIRLYRDDPRASFVFTVSKQNLTSVEEVTKQLTGDGLRVIFNIFSPTESYTKKIKAGAGNDNRFFRFSTEDRNMMLTAEDLEQVRGKMDEMIDLYPGQVFPTKAYNKRALGSELIYQLDGNGIATNCAGSNANPYYQLYATDGSPNRNKCCTPNVDCSTCRLWAPGIATLMFRVEEAVQSEQAFIDWIEYCETWGKLMMFEHELTPDGPPAPLRQPEAV